MRRRWPPDLQRICRRTAIYGNGDLTEDGTHMSRLEPLPPSQLRPEARRLYDAITQGPRASGPQHFALTREDGGLNGPFNAFLLNPGLGHALQALGAALRYEGTLSPRSREIAILSSPQRGTAPMSARPTRRSDEPGASRKTRSKRSERGSFRPCPTPTKPPALAWRSQ